MISTAEHDSTTTYALFCSNKGKSFFKGSGFYPTTASHTDPCFPPGDFYLCIFTGAQLFHMLKTT